MCKSVFRLFLAGFAALAILGTTGAVAQETTRTIVSHPVPWTQVCLMRRA